MNKNGFKVFKLEYEGETYHISAQTQEDAIQHLFTDHLDELTPTGTLIANEFPESEWEGFNIDYGNDLGEDAPDRFMKMSDYMLNENTTEIIASSEFN